MPPLDLLGWAFLGVLFSFALPALLVLVGAKSSPGGPASVAGWTQQITRFVTNRYVAVSILSLIVAVLVIALLEDEIATWNMALISGFSWQSILARFLTPGQ